MTAPCCAADLAAVAGVASAGHAQRGSPAPAPPAGPQFWSFQDRLLEDAARPLTELGLPPGEEVDAADSPSPPQPFGPLAPRHPLLLTPPPPSVSASISVSVSVSNTPNRPCPLPQQGSTLSAPPWPALKWLGLSRQPGSAQLELWLQDLRSQREDPNPPWASLRLTGMDGRPQFGPDLRSEAGVRTAHFLSQEKLNEDFYEFLEDKIQENLPHSSVDHYCDRMGNEPEEAQHTRVENFCDKIGNEPEEAQHSSVDDFCDKMGKEPEEAQDFDDSINSLKTKMFQLVELFCENLPKKSEEEVCSDLIVMESVCSADMADAVDAQVNNSESCPLLRETQQELRRRVCEPSGSYSLPGLNQPFDSSTPRNWSLDWLKQIAAAYLQGLCRAAEAIWTVLKGFCSSLEQLFKSLIQV
ncbi:hypothetical protein MJG53_017909 [Ovis ammon polii x Ovis aries]|uniref:Uncharacterized protein n=1 Tax=Ovis ammon polii x Ovis aries TaxID=2918886 RepID=A0ACB9U5T6_9CETA|nr:hypothetical protein MJG53_017909 [Ovis ammon polii x Ovis aries]